MKKGADLKIHDRNSSISLNNNNNVISNKKRNQNFPKDKSIPNESDPDKNFRPVGENSTSLLTMKLKENDSETRVSLLMNPKKNFHQKSSKGGENEKLFGHFQDAPKLLLHKTTIQKRPSPGDDSSQTPTSIKSPVESTSVKTPKSQNEENSPSQPPQILSKSSSKPKTPTEIPSSSSNVKKTPPIAVIPPSTSRTSKKTQKSPGSALTTNSGNNSSPSSSSDNTISLLAAPSNAHNQSNPAAHVVLSHQSVSSSFNWQSLMNNGTLQHSPISPSASSNTPVKTSSSGSGSGSSTNIILGSSSSSGSGSGSGPHSGFTPKTLLLNPNSPSVKKQASPTRANVIPGDNKPQNNNYFPQRKDKNVVLEEDIEEEDDSDDINDSGNSEGSMGKKDKLKRRRKKQVLSGSNNNKFSVESIENEEISEKPEEINEKQKKRRSSLVYEEAERKIPTVKKENIEIVQQIAENIVKQVLVVQEVEEKTKIQQTAAPDTKIQQTATPDTTKISQTPEESIQSDKSKESKKKKSAVKLMNCFFEPTFSLAHLANPDLFYQQQQMDFQSFKSRKQHAGPNSNTNQSTSGADNPNNLERAGSPPKKKNFETIFAEKSKNFERLIEMLKNDYQNYLIIGVLGEQGAGKSFILNQILKNKGQGDSIPENGKIFPEQSIKNILFKKHETIGLDLFVTKEHILFLDTQPLFSSSVFADYVQKGGDTNLSPDVMSLENYEDLLNIQMGLFLFSVCHVILTVFDASSSSSFQSFFDEQKNIYSPFGNLINPAEAETLFSSANGLESRNTTPFFFSSLDQIRRNEVLNLCTNFSTARILKFIQTVRMLQKLLPTLEEQYNVMFKRPFSSSNDQQIDNNDTQQTKQSDEESQGSNGRKEFVPEIVFIFNKFDPQVMSNHLPFISDEVSKFLDTFFLDSPIRKSGAISPSVWSDINDIPEIETSNWNLNLNLGSLKSQQQQKQNDQKLKQDQDGNVNFFFFPKIETKLKNKKKEQTNENEDEIGPSSLEKKSAILIQTLRHILFGMTKERWSQEISEKKWLQTALRLWDTIKRSQILQVYNRSFQKLSLYKG